MLYCFPMLKNKRNAMKKESSLPEGALSSRDFTKMACAIALPIAAQNMINTLVNSADVVMLGYVSQTALSASSLANQVQFILGGAYYGLMAGAGILVAQYWGKKDTVTIERVLGLALRFSMLLSVLFFLPAFFCPGLVMRIFTNEKPIIEEGARYLKYISFTYLLQGFSQMYLAVIRSKERVILPAVTSSISLSLNILINAIFIFGLFGAPKLGLVGVAIGTLAARVLEVLICVIDSMRSKDVKFRVSRVFEKGGVLIKDLLKLGAPAMINDIAWSMAFSMYSVILGHMGSDAVAANSVAQIARNLGTVLCFGFANGTAIILGKAISEKGVAVTRLYAKRMVRITSVAGIVGGLLILAVRPLLLLFAGNLTKTAASYLNMMLLINSYYVWAQGVNTCWICGCFRAGGDTRWGMICDILDMWCFSVPLGFLAAFVLKLPVLWVYFLLCLDEFVKIPFVIHHFNKFTWIRNITRNEEELA